MNIPSRFTSPHPGFSVREYEALHALRTKYLAGLDLFTEPELARLRFVRWLVHAPEWNTAMDQPMPTQPWTRTLQQVLPWMPGSAD